MKAYFILMIVVFLINLIYYLFSKSERENGKIRICVLCLLIFLTVLAYQEWQFTLAKRPKVIRVLNRREVLNPKEPYKDSIIHYDISKIWQDTIELRVESPVLVIIEKK